MERHVGPDLGKPAVHLDHLLGVGVLERHGIPRESDRVEQFAVLEGARQHWPDRIVLGELLLLGGIDAAAVHAHSHGTVVLRGHVGDESYLVLPGLRRLVVVEMAGVVSQLVDMRGHVDGEPVVFLEVDGEVGLRTGPDGGQGCGV